MSFWKQSLRLSTRMLRQSTTHLIVSDSRYIHRWVAPTLKELARRREAVGPEPERPRSSYLEWNYDMEIHCFCKRLGEKYDNKLLKEAFIQQEWANLQEFKAQESGNESFTPLQHNYKLAQDGGQIISDYIIEYYSKSFPTDVVKYLCNYLTTDEMLAHIAKHLGVKDLIKSVEYPPETKTFADTLKAIIAALSLSTNIDRAKLFVKDFVICQMNGKDIYDIWTPEKPYDYLTKLLQDRGVHEIEPRLCNQSATNTILASYRVGLYNPKDKSCLGLGWGESIQIAKDTAALDAIQRIYSSYVPK